MSFEDVSVVIPCFNEEKAVGKVVAVDVTLDVSYPTRLTQLDPVRVLDPHEHDLVQNLFASLTSHFLPDRLPEIQ